MMLFSDPEEYNLMCNSCITNSSNPFPIEHGICTVCAREKEWGYEIKRSIDYKITQSIEPIDGNIKKWYYDEWKKYETEVVYLNSYFLCKDHANKKIENILRWLIGVTTRNGSAAHENKGAPP